MPTDVKRVVVTTSALYVRAAPSAEADVKGQVHRGDVLEVVETSPDGLWFAVLHGWVRSKYTRALLAQDPQEPEWFAVARRELERGICEVPGAGSEPSVVTYLKSTTLGKEPSSSDETAWCSAFVNWCVEQTGLEGTDSAAARSWLRWGEALNTPSLGCVVVFSRPDAGPHAGHVGFFVSQDPAKGTIDVLGGNQDDCVSIKAYPAGRLLGFRTSS